AGVRAADAVLGRPGLGAGFGDAPLEIARATVDRDGHAVRAPVDRPARGIGVGIRIGIRVRVRVALTDRVAVLVGAAEADPQRSQNRELCHDLLPPSETALVAARRSYIAS